MDNSYLAFDTYKPHADWYLRDPFGIHGLAHAGRVLVWSHVICSQLHEQGVAVDIEVVRWAATFHDVRRIDDGRDMEHGIRAAEWLEGHSAPLTPNLDFQQWQQVIFCCRWHVHPDSLIPDMTLELTCLKDADGLDRVRLGDLKPAFLRTARAKELVSSAQQLYDASALHNACDPWGRVRKAALELGFWA
jgi:uncharacterized protein